MEVLARLQAGASCRRTDQGGTGNRMKNVGFCSLEAMQETRSSCGMLQQWC
jgi:hypothetical protein